MRRNVLSVMLILNSLLTSGCANLQLHHSTVRQASTITDLQYQQVLNNLAMFSDDPYALPWSLSLKAGSTQVSDSGTLTANITSGGAGLRGPVFGATRAIVDQWGTVPVTDDNTITILRYAYQNAFGAHWLLSEEAANDMAFDFATQLGTNADISTDSDTWRAMLALSKPTDDAREKRKAEREATARKASNDAMTIEGLVGVIQDVRKDLARKTGNDFYLNFDQLINSLTTSANNERIIEEYIKQDEFGFYYSTNSFAIEKASIEIVKAEGKVKILNNISERHTFVLTEIQEHLRDLMQNALQIDAYLKPVAEQTQNVQGIRFDERLEQYDNLTKQITSTLDEKVLEQKADGMFKTAGTRATGLSKAVAHKVNEIQETLMEIHSGWFQIGRRKDIPHDACYVGFYRSCGKCRFHNICNKCSYVWVCSGQRAELATFTLQILKLSSEFKETQVYNVPSGIQFSPAYTTPR